jgi:hypothetical protein
VRRHVSAEVLALYQEGAVGARRAARIIEHLSACAECSGIDSDLAAVPGLLATVQLPPMPDAIAGRIQLAIANEAAARAAMGTTSAVSLTDAADPGLASAGADAGSTAGAGADAGEPGQIPGRPDLPDRARGRSRRFRMPGWSSPLVLRGLAAAGAVVVIAGAGLLFANNHVGLERSTANGSGSGRPAGAPARPAPSHRVKSSGLSHGLYSGETGPVNLSYRLKGKMATASALATHHNYTKSNMAPLVHKDVTSAFTFEKGPQGTSRSASKAVFGGVQVQTLVGCLTRLAAGRAVLVADVARYLGRPATIVVLRPAAGSHVLDVVVVGLSCSSAAPEIIAQVTVPAG